MKIFVKQFVIAALVAFIAVPAMASELNDTPRMPTKGSKSYQAARPVKSEPATTEQAETTNGDVSKIAPAAGDQEMEKTKPEKTNSLKDSMRLPRKN